MKIVLDTNVFVSGVFFGGVPGRILDAWRDGRLALVLSPEIFDEYDAVGRELTSEHPGVDLGLFLGLVLRCAESIQAQPLSVPICDDPDDDKFIACAFAANAQAIVTGDKDLLRLSGKIAVEILRPREFVEKYLES